MAKFAAGQAAEGIWVYIEIDVEGYMMGKGLTRSLKEDKSGHKSIYNRTSN